MWEDRGTLKNKRGGETAVPRAANEQEPWVLERSVNVLEVLWMVRTSGP